MLACPDDDPRRAGTIWAANLDDPLPVTTPLIEAAFCPAGPASLPALATALGQDASADMLQRFATGRRCYAAWVEGRVAAYGWVSFDEEFVGELNLRLRLLPGEAYIWDCVTAPPFRRHHLYTALLGYILHELRAMPVCRAWIGANQENVPSQRGIARAGFHRVADVLVARVLTLRQVWVQGYPDVPESLVSEARRAFLDNRDKVWLNALAAAKQAS